MAVPFDSTNLNTVIKLFVNKNIHCDLDDQDWKHMIYRPFLLVTGSVLDCKHLNLAGCAVIIREGCIYSRRWARLSVADDNDDVAEALGGSLPPAIPDTPTSSMSPICPNKETATEEHVAIIVPFGPLLPPQSPSCDANSSGYSTDAVAVAHKKKPPSPITNSPRPPPTTLQLTQPRPSLQYSPVDHKRKYAHALTRSYRPVVNTVQTSSFPV